MRRHKAAHDTVRQFMTNSVPSPSSRPLFDFAGSERERVGWGNWARMIMQAVSSHRRDLVLTPYPCVYGGQTSKEAVLHPSNKQKDLKVLTDTIAEVLSLRKREGPRLGAAWTGLDKSERAPPNHQIPATIATPTPRTLSY